MGSEGRGITQHLPDIMPTPGILPQGWVYTTLGDIGEINPKLLDECLRRDIDVTFLPMRCLEELTGNLDLSLTRKLSDVKKGYTPFKNGDVIFAKITPCMENGKVAVVHGLRNGIGFGSTEFHVIRLPESFPREFMFYSLVREELRRDARANMTGSAGQLRVPVNYLRQMPIALPPLLEQHRIVAKIEELSTRLDAGVHALRAIKAQLKRYRQAVLKHAFEGKLTAEWHEAHQHELEPASVLLERIRQERQKNAKGKYKELPQLDTSGLPELPEGWVWSSLAYSARETYRYPTFYGMEHLDRGTPVIRGEHIKGDTTISHDWTDYWFVSDEVSSRFPRTITEIGDIIMSVRGSVGKLGVVDEQLRGAQVSPNCIRVALFKEECLTAFVVHYLKSMLGQATIRGLINATTIQTIKASLFTQIYLPLPPVAEQHRIVEEIERRFSVADQIERTVDQGLKQAERLRQSILKKAFEGKLVPQDPSDEPAEMLLERIEKRELDCRLEPSPRERTVRKQLHRK